MSTNDSMIGVQGRDDLRVWQKEFIQLLRERFPVIHRRKFSSLHPSIYTSVLRSLQGCFDPSPFYCVLQDIVPFWALSALSSISEALTAASETLSNGSEDLSASFATVI